MTIHGRHELTWKGRRLYHKSTVLETTAKPVMAVEPSERFPTMFYVVWPDGVKSADFYNLTRAKSHAIDIALAELNNTDPPSEI